MKSVIISWCFRVQTEKLRSLRMILPYWAPRKAEGSAEDIEEIETRNLILETFESDAALILEK